MEFRTGITGLGVVLGVFLGGGGDAVCPFYREACLFPRGVLVSGDSLGVRERFSTICTSNGSLRRG